MQKKGDLTLSVSLLDRDHLFLVYIQRYKYNLHVQSRIISAKMLSYFTHFIYLIQLSVANSLIDSAQSINGYLQILPRIATQKLALSSAMEISFLMLKKHLLRIKNTFTSSLSNDSWQDSTNKIKRIKRISYGQRNLVV